MKEEYFVRALCYYVIEFLTLTDEKKNSLANKLCRMVREKAHDIQQKKKVETIYEIYFEMSV